MLQRLLVIKIKSDEAEIINNGSLKLISTGADINGKFNGTVPLNIQAPSGYRVIGMLDEYGNLSSTVLVNYHFTDPKVDHTYLRAIVVPTTPIRLTVYFQQYVGDKLQATKEDEVTVIYGSTITVTPQLAIRSSEVTSSRLIMRPCNR